MKTEIFLATRYLFRGKAHHVSFISIISCIGVTLGVSTLVVVISVMNGFDKDLMEKLLRFSYHITVESIDKEIPQDIIEKIKNTDGVNDVSIFIQTQLFAKFNKYIIPLVVKGIDFNNPNESRIFRKYLLEEKETEGFFIGQGLKNKFFLEEKLVYYPLERRLKLNEDKIKGVFRVGLYDIDNNYVVCSLDKAKSLSDNYLVSLGLRVKDPFKVERVKNSLKELSKRGYIVNTWIETNQVLFSALKLEKITMFIILSLIIVVASFNIFATLTVKVVEKTKDIGILRALGFSSRKILSVFSIQGIILGSIGVSFGVSLGLLICVMLKEYQFIKIPQQIYYIEYLPVSLNAKDIILISLLGVILAFISSLFPAVRASRLKPCQALRYE